MAAAARGGADVFLPPAQSGGGSPGGPGGAKIMGLERNTFLIVVVVAGVAAYLLYRHFKNSSSSSAAATPAPDTTTPTPAGTPDNAGGGGATGPNPVSSTPDYTPFEDIISQLIGAITTPSTTGTPGGLQINILPQPGGPSATKTATPPAAQTILPVSSAPLATPIAPDPYSTAPGASGGNEPSSAAGANAAFGITPGGDNGPPPITAPAVSPGVAVGSPGAATASSPGKTVGGYRPGGAIKT